MKKEYLVSVKEMKQLDSNTINVTGLPSLVLMERAAFAVAMQVMNYLKEDKNAEILIVAGNGNNGADGVCAGRILKEYGYFVDICVLKSSHEYTEEMKVQLNASAKYSIPLIDEKDIDFNRYRLIVDAIFGIGINRDIEGSTKELIERINESRTYVISVDIPSGVNATTGSVYGVAVEADETLTFGFYKCGQLFYPGRKYCGNVTKAKIGINETSFYGMIPQMFSYIKETDVDKVDYVRDVMGNKGTFGKVLVIAGRVSTAGAAILCAQSALRSGCGMVALITEEENKGAVLSTLPEAMLETYGKNDAGETLTEKIQKWLAWADVAVIGPGLLRDEISYQLMHDLLQYGKIPVVCDADALQLFAVHEKLRDNVKQYTLVNQVVFTPHPGELASLAGCSITDIKAERLHICEKVCRQYGVTLIAKDADTLCVKEDVPIYLNSTGNDGLSTAGSGDVLAGLCASLIGQSIKNGMTLYEAVCLAIFIHGYAADICATRTGKRFMVASDIIEAYKYILK